MQYALIFQPDTGGYAISSRDFPELNSQGDDLADAQKQALDAIETCFIMYMEDRRPIPLPTAAQPEEVLIRVPVRVAAKVALYNEMLAQKVTKAEIARRLGWHQTQADRLLSVLHSTKLEAIEAAFAALGRHLNVAMA